MVSVNQARRSSRDSPRASAAIERADRQLVVDELLLGHVDVVGEELVADLLEAAGRFGGRVADLGRARREWISLERDARPLRERGYVDHLADEVVVVQRDPPVGMEQPVYFGEEAGLVEPVQARAHGHRVERAVGERQLFGGGPHKVCVHGIDRAREHLG